MLRKFYERKLKELNSNLKVMLRNENNGACFNAATHTTLNV